MKLYFLFFCCFIICCTQHKAPVSTSEAGLLGREFQFYHIENDSSKPTWGRGMDQRIWYKDGMTIKDIKSFHSTKAGDQVTATYPVDCYLFKYPPSGLVYEYGNFSDTAKLLQVFKANAYVTLINGTAYRDDGIPALTGQTNLDLPDTLINKISFKRILMSGKDSTGKDYYFLEYFRCDKREGILKSYNLNIAGSEKAGCPLVKADAILSPQKKLPLFSEEIVFLADSLTRQEEKVFAAWEKRAQKDVPPSTN